MGTQKGIATIRRALMVALFSIVAAVSWGLGLGEIRTDAALSEPFSAQLPVTNLGNVDPDRLLVSLGTVADFERADLERPVFLADLSFAVEKLADGRVVINISSEEPVEEPYLDFLVALEWPSGRILRQYTVLLDLPVFANEQAAPVAVEAPRRVEPAAPTEAPRPQPPRRQASNLAVGDETYRVASGDTLWSIANRMDVPGATTNDTMLALYEANPNAFIRGDINMLKAGSVLRLPDNADVRAAADRPVAPSQPAAASSQQTSAPQLDATASTSASRSAEQKGGVLQLVSTDEITGGGGDSAGAVDKQVEAVSNELAIARDELSRSELENEELRERLAKLEEQVQTQQNILELQNEQLESTQLAAAVANTSEQAQAEAEPPPPAAAEEGMFSFMPWYGWVLIALILGLVVFLLVRRQQGKDDDAWLEDDQDSAVEPARGAAVAGAAVATAAVASTQHDDEPEIDLDSLIYVDEEESQDSDVDTFDDEGGDDEEGGDDDYDDEDEDDDDEEGVDEFDWDDDEFDGEDDDDSDDSDDSDEDDELYAASSATAALNDAQLDDEALSDDELGDLELNLDRPDAMQPKTTYKLDDDGSSLDDLSFDFETDNSVDNDDFSSEDDLLADVSGLEDEEFSLMDEVDQFSAEAENGAIERSSLDDDIDDLMVNVEGDHSAGMIAGDLMEDLADLPSEDELETKMQLARAFIDMGDREGAREMLAEIVNEANGDQKSEAEQLLAGL